MTPVVGVSAAATALAVLLLVLAARRLARALAAGPQTTPLPASHVPALLAGWIGLLAFGAGMYLGRTFWH